MAGAGARMILPNQQILGADGSPLVGALLYTYETGTTTPLTTYNDSALSVPNPNPLVSDPNGFFGNVFLLSSPAYKFVLTTADNVQIWAMDPVGPAITNAGQVPVGASMNWNASAAPAGWLLEYGQAISRTTYSALFAVIGTTYGDGDGSTTFNLPDCRGRVSAGLDNMGGTAANRLTSAGSGVNGAVIGGTGGDQLLMAHTHALTDPGHMHDFADPGHSHNQQWGQGNGGGYVPTSNITSNGSTFSISNYTTINAYVGITIDSATTGITIATAGSGAGQNVQPTLVRPTIIYAGVGG